MLTGEPPAQTFALYPVGARDRGGLEYAEDLRSRQTSMRTPRKP